MKGNGTSGTKSPARSTRRGRRLSARAIVGIVAAVVALAVAPIIGYAWPITADYAWYTESDGSASDPYEISTPDDFAGFINLVNGTADVDGDGNASDQDSFAGKTVVLTGDINFRDQTIIPAGGQNGASFDGTFDGQGHTVDNFELQPNGSAVNVGLIGAAGANSLIQNVTIGSVATLTIEYTADQSTQRIENVGMLVGYSEGSIANCTSLAYSGGAKMTLSHAMDQTPEIVFPIKNVGGLAGQVLGSVTNCTNEADISIAETGNAYKAASDDTTWQDQSSVVINVGGIVGCLGDQDSSLDEIEAQGVENTSASARGENRHGSIANCSNSGTIEVDTPSSNGTDRFNNPVTVTSSNVGGIVGYSRGSIDSCTNSGYLDMAHASGAAGIVGSLRAATTTTSYSGNFTQTGSDDGSAEDPIEITNCSNTGSVYGLAFPAGIASRCGTYTTVTGCINGTSTTNTMEQTYIIGTRATKPFPSGIVGSTYGVVRYCANFGTVVSGDWLDEEARTVSPGGGYYASGIVGNTVYYTEIDDTGTQVRSTPIPEVYGCYNAGTVTALANMRQRAIVGDNAGYVHDNLSEINRVTGNYLVYGMYSEDTESSGGTFSNNYLVTADQLKGNLSFPVYDTDGTVLEESSGFTVLGLLNTRSEADGWVGYWAKSDGTVNGGYPVLGRQVSWDLTDISNATVELVSNAQYTGLASSPTVAVRLADGTELQQNVDFRVIPQENATEITDEGQTPYTASVEGIGNYTGQSANTVRYGIDAGDISTCTVSIDAPTYDWEPQELSYDVITVTNAAGVEVDPAEYTFRFSEDNDGLTDGQAIDAGTYIVDIVAVEGGHFVGSTTGELRVKTAKIVWDSDPEQLVLNAYPVSINYLGESIPWESTIYLGTLPEGDNDPANTFAYTGHPILPEVEQVVYLGRDLVEGRDYRVTYGDGILSGGTSVAGTENIGTEGEIARGYIQVRYVSGSNFSNQENMEFLIDGTSDERLNLAQAVIRGTDDVVYEEGRTYTPVTVWYGGGQLTEGTDYTITYSNNTAIGTASFTVTGIGRYTGTVTGTFNIVSGVVYELSYDFDDVALTATVTGVSYFGTSDSFGIVIPSTVEHNGAVYTVTEIGDNAFGASSASQFTTDDPRRKISSVAIPATVERIGQYAFASGSVSDWNALETVTFVDISSSKLTTIDIGAFQGCGNLTSFVFPASVETIANRAFELGTSTQTSKLTTLTFLTTSADLPSSIGTTNTFRGVGSEDVVVTVYGYGSASAVKALAEGNAGTGSSTVNKGKNFVFAELSADAVFRVLFATGDGASGTAPTIDDQLPGTAFTIPSADGIVRWGYTFTGWLCSADNLVYQAGDVYTMPASAVTFTAQWEFTGFIDVDYFGETAEGGWMAEWIDQAAALGLMSGYRDSATQELTGEFGPQDNLTRGQAVVVLYRAMTGAADDEAWGVNETPSVEEDVVTPNYYTNALNWAYENDIMTGDTDPTTGEALNTLRPSDHITRQELALLVWRAVGEPEAADDSAYRAAADAGIEWAVATPALMWTAEQGILSGSQDSDGIHLNAFNNTRRGEAAKVFVTSLEFLQEAAK